jgi:pyridoxal phosphate enzyme (YggS family)
MTPLETSLTAIQTRIRTAAEAAGRDPATVRLLAVSKTHPPEAIRLAAAVGQLAFGENKIQEALEKILALQGPPTSPQTLANLEWHFIGHLQTNKIRKALPHFRLFHGIDRPDVAAKMDRIAAESGAVARILLEVNVAGEATKFGFSPESLRAEIAGLCALPNLRVVGLMTMAPATGDPRPIFAALRALRDELQEQTGHPLPELSMGMSGDFEAAIAEGSTLVRIGSAIFGERPE